MYSEELERRQFKHFPHLQHRLFDPQIYLAELDAHTAEEKVKKLASYPWFGADVVPKYESDKHGSMRAHRERYAAERLEHWTREAPSDSGDVAAAARAAIEYQLGLGCEAIILASPLTTGRTRPIYQTEVRWMDAGIAACENLGVRLPIFATVAVSDAALRGIGRSSLLDAIAGHIVARDELAGAYVLVEQGNQQHVDCRTPDIILSLLELTHDLVHRARRRVIVNYMGTLGALASAAGAEIWGTGYYPSQRKLRLLDLDNREEARAYPRYFSLRLLGDVGVKHDLLRLCQAGFGSRVFTETESAKPLHAALKRGESPDTIPLWAFKAGNHALAMPHYYESVYQLGTHLHSLPVADRPPFVQRLLEQAASLASELRTLKPKLDARTELSHQDAWLNTFKAWRKQAGV